jgi:putative restriction endonuclease
MNESDLFDLLANLRRARGQGPRADSQAPHKPLLLLVLLKKLEDAAPNEFTFAELKDPFQKLWKKYGWTTPGKAAYPFWYLTNDDGLWAIKSDAGAVRTTGHAPPADGMMVKGGFRGSFQRPAIALLGRRDVRRRAIDLIVERYFRESVRDELRQDLDLAWEPDLAAEEEVLTSKRTGRDPAAQSRFRAELMLAYEGRCSVCGFGPRDARPPSAVAAAHIWPWEEGGPTEPENGVALCPVHHWALDACVLAFTDDLRVLVSARVSDGPTLDAFVRSYSGTPLRPPQRGFPRPDVKFVRLQRERLFLGRPIAA